MVEINFVGEYYLFPVGIAHGSEAVRDLTTSTSQVLPSLTRCSSKSTPPVSLGTRYRGSHQGRVQSVSDRIRKFNCGLLRELGDQKGVPRAKQKIGGNLFLSTWAKLRKPVRNGGAQGSAFLPANPECELVIQTIRRLARVGLDIDAPREYEAIVIFLPGVGGARVNGWSG